MTIYVILVFAAIIVGMIISVSAFGTGSKRAKMLKEIYYSIEDVDGKGVLYAKTGEYSAMLKFENLVQKYSANIDSYYDFSALFTSLMATLGEGYSLHKQDVFIRRQFKDDSGNNHELLSDSYFRYFTGRQYSDCRTFLTIT